MTKAGLYHYISGKEALLFEIMMFGMDQVHAEVVTPVQAIQDPEERLRQIVIRHARIITRAQGAVANLVDEVKRLPVVERNQIERRMRSYFDLVRSTLFDLRAIGRMRDVDPTVAAFSILGMIIWLPRWFRQQGRLTAEQLAEEIATLALGGLLRSETRVQQRRQPISRSRARRPARTSP
jgi:AcrR family transcriptional regulator